MIKQNKLKILLKKKIEENFPKKEVFSLYLFGSYAWGKPNSNSDIDLLLISDDNNNPHFLVKKLYQTFADIEQDIDILGYQKNVLEKKINSNKFLKNILTNGKIIYESRI